MNSRTIRFIKNFSYTLSSNFVSLIISTLVVLIVPKLIGIEEYGYWQLYLFYSAYVGFLHFGWSDGIYLRYGGEDYKKLDKGLFFSQFYMMVFVQVTISLLISITSIFLYEDSNRVFIFLMVAINLIIVNILSLLLLTLQATNRIKEYAQIMIISRVLYISLIVFFILVGIRDYRFMIVSDLLGKFISLLYAIRYCKDIIFLKFNKFFFCIEEILKNIRVGSKLMFANIASMLIIGVIRFGIERSWDVSTFGKVSLTLSVSNILMLFINAVGIVIFPILRRTEHKNLNYIYKMMRDILMLTLFGILLLYYPIKSVLSYWLPRYADSLKYMVLLFPICIYEGKVSLLVNTYLKTLRKEKAILRINMIILIFSVIITLFTTIIFRNLDFAILSILLLLLIRSMLAEWYLSRLINVSVIKDNILETILTLIFIMICSYINPKIGILVYLISYILYILIKRKQLLTTFYKLKKHIVE